MAGRARPPARAGKEGPRLHFEKHVRGVCKGAPPVLPAPPGPGPGWTCAEPGDPSAARSGLPQARFGGAGELGGKKVSPHQTPKKQPSKRERVWDHEFSHSAAGNGAPRPSSVQSTPPRPAFLKVGAPRWWHPGSPRRRAPPRARELGCSPVCPSAPLTSAAPLHAQPRAAPRDALCCAARPARGHSQPPVAPSPASGRRRAGDGSEGRPAPLRPPGRRTPRHAWPVGLGAGVPPAKGGLQNAPSVRALGRLRTQRRAQGRPQDSGPGPGAAGSWSLCWSTKKQAGAALPPSRAAPSRRLLAKHRPGFGVRSRRPRSVDGPAAPVPRSPPGPAPQHNSRASRRAPAPPPPPPPPASWKPPARPGRVQRTRHLEARPESAPPPLPASDRSRLGPGRPQTQHHA